jgi:hypothetical protein
MKTKDLIALLQRVDPSGELHVCMQDNSDVYDAHKIPAFWEGRQDILVRDDSNPFFNVQGGIVNGTGDKVILSGMSIETALCHKPSMPVLILGGDVTGEYAARIQRWREEGEQYMVYQQSQVDPLTN